MICKECLRSRNDEYSYNKDFCTLRCKQQNEAFKSPFGWKWSIKEIDSETGKDIRFVHPLISLNDRLKVFK